MRPGPGPSTARGDGRRARGRAGAWRQPAARGHARRHAGHGARRAPARPALERQHEALRTGHCGLLPEAQVAPMARVQLARDRSLAQTAQQALRPGQTVLLVAGAGHVRRGLGVPTWLPQGLAYKVAIAQAGQAQPAIEREADWIHATPALPPRDHCAELRARWQSAPGATPAPAAAP
ncbi:ChaN family lipoprotein [Paenacidovorax monticola]|uniref:ChaN family lipoprotein n=1 Tax=Paenacidovorax monticola TaxID=1926868 RepID=UPI003EBCB6A6